MRFSLMPKIVRDILDCFQPAICVDKLHLEWKDGHLIMSKDLQACFHGIVGQNDLVEFAVEGAFVAIIFVVGARLQP